MKRYILYILCALLAVLCITGCESKEERAQRKENEKQAAEQAVQYIYEKYGFTPEVLSSNSDYLGGMFGNRYCQTYFIKMVYEEKEFLVFIDGEEARDSYQHEEIYQALRTEINDRIPGAIELRLEGHQFFHRAVATNYKDCLCSEYFDGTNLIEVLNDCRGRFRAYYVHGDFSDESLFTWLGNTDSETEESSNAFRGQFVSLRSEDALAAISSSTVLSGIGYGDMHRLARGRYALCVESYRDTEGIYEQYNLNQYGDLYYLIYLSGSRYNQPDHDILSIGEGEPPSSSELSGKVGSRYYTASEAFDLNIYERALVIVFYPVSKLDGGFVNYRTDFLDIEDQTYNYTIADRIGDYVVGSCWFSPGDHNICFINERDTEE